MELTKWERLSRPAKQKLATKNLFGIFGRRFFQPWPGKLSKHNNKENASKWIESGDAQEGR